MDDVNRPPYIDELYGLSRRGELDELVRRCLEINDELEKRPTDAYPETALMVEGLAQAYYSMGDYCAAAIELERAVQIHRDHHNYVSDLAIRCLYLLGRMYLWTGRPAESEETLTEALTILEQLPENEQRGRGFVLLDLADMHLWEGELDTAEHLMHQSIKPMLRYYGYGNRHFAYTYFHLAKVYEKQGRTFAADRTADKAFRWLRLAIDEDDDVYASTLSSNGLRLKKRGRLSEARAAQAEALAILQRIRKPGHFMLEKVKHRLAALDAVPVPSAG